MVHGESHLISWLVGFHIKLACSCWNVNVNVNC